MPRPIPPPRRPSVGRTSQRSLWGLLLLVLLFSGCVNSLVMVSRVLMGDPVQTSAFERVTHVKLKKDKKRIVVHCSAPALLQSKYSTLSGDLQNALHSRLKRRRIDVLPADASARIVDDSGGRFDPQQLARELPNVDYVFHIQVESFKHYEDSSSSLLRGTAQGQTLAYELRGEGAARHAVQVFSNAFNYSYPGNYPIAADQTSEAAFIQQFLDHLADRLGTVFYDVGQLELMMD